MSLACRDYLRPAPGLQQSRRVAGRRVCATRQLPTSLRRRARKSTYIRNQTTYDAAKNVAYWQTRPVVATSRFMEIGWEFGQWAIRTRLSGPDGSGAGPAGMREILTRLGPAFVKIGQALSSRPDIMDPEYLKELEKLQDRIPPFPDDQAFAVIEADLGMKLPEIFSEITPNPIAAASLGQVYRAKLTPAAAALLGDAVEALPSGPVEVAVKVQRPGVMEAIALDTYILRLLAGVLRKARKVNTDLPSLVDEWASSLFRELDYTREAANGIQFAEMYGQLPQVYVPGMYTALTTPRVLVMEWINGRRLRSEEMPAGAGRWAVGPSLAEVEAVELALVEVGVQCSLEQMLGQGFYHADPHPGNLMRTDDGQLAFLDFGMMGQVEPETRAALMRATLHLVNREYPSLANDLVDLGLLPSGSDRSEIVPAITGVFEEALKGGVSNLSFGALSANLGATMYRYKFRIPPFYTLLVRSLTVLEGIALSYDSNYKVLGAAYPWVARRLLSGTDPLLEDTLQALLYKGGRFQFDRLESLIQQALKSPPRVRGYPLLDAPPPSPASTFSLPAGLPQDHDQLTEALQKLLPLPLPQLPFPLPSLQACPLVQALLPWPFPQPTPSSLPAAGAADGSSFLPTPPELPADARSDFGASSSGRAAGGALSLVLSMEGRVVRRILVDEVAAGLDAAWRVSADNLLASLPLGRGLGLAEAQDREQLDGLSRLAAALSAGSAKGAGGGQQEWSMQQAASILNWLVQEVASAPPSQQQEGMVLVREVAQQLASRITARTLRSLFAVSLP